MNKLIIAINTMLLTGPIIALSGRAEQQKPEFDFKASAGYQHDSNVNMADLDTNTGEADDALLLELGFDGKLPVNDKLSFTLGYGYTSTAYQTYSDFDLAIHHLGAAAEYRFTGFNAGLSVDRFAAQLDGEGYLDLTQVAPSLSHFFGERLYVRGSYIVAEKSYAAYPARDADNDALRADVYVLFNGMQRFLAFSYVMDSEDAFAGEFDYDGLRSTIAYGHRLEFGRTNFDLKAHLQFGSRDYVSVTESIGVPRRDESFRTGLTAAIPVSEHLELRGEAEYAKTDSNFDAANFDETVYSVNAGMKF
jgi:hypothetical protein